MLSITVSVPEIYPSLSILSVLKRYANASANPVDRFDPRVLNPDNIFWDILLLLNHTNNHLSASSFSDDVNEYAP
jgi:hypothetical protein